jgi:hypothetical protein
MEDYLLDLSKEDLELSQRALELLKGKIIEKFRWDSSRHELFLEFNDGTRVFIDNIQNKDDISIT